MTLLVAPPIKIPARLATDPELRAFFFELSRSLQLIFEHLRKLDTTAALTTITHTAPGTPDYAIQNLSAGGFGFATADEGNSVLKVIANLQTRVDEIESHFQG